jgi:transcriptional regulator with XRE-family HTH domain
MSSKKKDSVPRMSILRYWLKANGISYEDLAAKIGVTAPALNHYVNGRNFPSAPTLMRLSEVTGIAPSELIRSR